MVFLPTCIIIDVAGVVIVTLTVGLVDLRTVTFCAVHCFTVKAKL